MLRIFYLTGIVGMLFGFFYVKGVYIAQELSHIELKVKRFESDFGGIRIRNSN